jgi:ribosome-associated toxin RatA of RatAB toxin-antitoxin module
MRLEHTVRVNAKASDVWAKLNDWGGVWRYQPWVINSPLLSANNEGVGASRRCEFIDKTSIVETITKIKEGRRIDMTLSDTPKPMKGGTTSIIVTPKGENQTEVTVSMNIKLGLGPLNPIMGNLMMKPMMRTRITKMLESLEYHIKTGGKIDSKGIKHIDGVASPMVAAR